MMLNARCVGAGVRCFVGFFMSVVVAAMIIAMVVVVFVLVAAIFIAAVLVFLVVLVLIVLITFHKILLINHRKVNAFGLCIIP